jgi:hypothetical protein
VVGPGTVRPVAGVNSFVGCRTIVVGGRRKVQQAGAKTLASLGAGARLDVPPPPGALLASSGSLLKRSGRRATRVPAGSGTSKVADP